MGFLQEIATEIEQRGIAMPPPATAGVAELVAGEIVESEAALQVRLLETGGLGDGIRVHNRPGVSYVPQTMQITVRGTTYEAARAKVQELYTFFNGSIRNQFLSGTWYVGLDALQPPAQFGRDRNERWYFGFNAAALKRPS